MSNLKRLIVLSLGLSAFAAPAIATDWVSIPDIPGLILKDQDGVRRDLSKLISDRPVLIGFIFAGCSTICPATTQHMQIIKDALDQRKLQGGQKPLLLSISIDMTDTPASLRDFASDQNVRVGAGVDWLMLTADGPDPDIRPLLEVFEQPIGNKDLHNDLVWMGRPSEHRWTYTGAENTELIVNALLDGGND